MKEPVLLYYFFGHKVSLKTDIMFGEDYSKKNLICLNPRTLTLNITSIIILFERIKKF